MDRTDDSLRNQGGRRAATSRGMFAEFIAAFEEFKRTNDQRLGEIEKRGSADGLLEDKLDRLNAALDGQKSAMDRALAERARPLLEGKAVPRPDERIQGCVFAPM